MSVKNPIGRSFKQAPGIDTDYLRSLSRLERARYMVAHQRRWIEWCEGSKSYDGPNGAAIRKADADALEAYASELAMLAGQVCAFCEEPDNQPRRGEKAIKCPYCQNLMAGQ